MPVLSPPPATYSAHNETVTQMDSDIIAQALKNWCDGEHTGFSYLGD